MDSEIVHIIRSVIEHLNWVLELKVNIYDEFILVHGCRKWKILIINDTSKAL